MEVSKRHKKSGRRKMDEVERLAEMERQRRQKEAEQKVNHNTYTVYYTQTQRRSKFLLTEFNFLLCR